MPIGRLSRQKCSEKRNRRDGYKKQITNVMKFPEIVMEQFKKIWEELK